jgi:LCP family protein required for cell wall assembly
MNKAKKKRSKVLNAILIGLIVLLGVMTVILLVNGAGKGLIPMNYTGIIAIVSAAIIVLSIIALRRKWSNIVMIIISAVASAIAILGTGVTGAVTHSVEEITKPERSINVSEMKVAVLKDSPLQTISDLKDKSLGYYSNISTDELAKIKTYVDEKVEGVVYSGENDIALMADVLRDKELDAIVINESYFGILEEIEGYETFEEEVRYIDSFNIETDVALKPQSNPDTFLLYISGIDTFGNIENTSRSDVNILAAVNTKTKHIQLINTPRDTYVYLPNSGDMKDKLTHAGIYGVDNSIATLSKLYGKEINHYLRMNFSGFEEIIDAIGGIDVYSDTDFTVTGGGYTFHEGMNHMSGIEALAFARERKAFAEGDHMRGKHQMDVITATLSKLTSSREFLTNYGTILSSMSGSFQTSMPQETVYKLIGDQLSSSTGWKVDNYAISGSGTFANTFSMPGTSLYVMVPNDSDIETAKQKIDAVLNE